MWAAELWAWGANAKDARRAQRPGPGQVCLHGAHAVLRQKRDLQDFGAGQDGLVAGGGHGLARDAVDLVEGVWPQQTVVRRPDEQLQREGLALQVAVELGRETSLSTPRRPLRSN